MRKEKPKKFLSFRINLKLLSFSFSSISNLFFSQEAEKEEKAKGPESELHIIIFDELDAICKERGSTQGTSKDSKQK